MRGAKHSGAKEYAEIFVEWLEKQKIEDEKELTREELRKELEKSIEIKEKELQRLKERLKRRS